MRTSRQRYGGVQCADLRSLGAEITGMQPHLKDCGVQGQFHPGSSSVQTQPLHSVLFFFFYFIFFYDQVPIQVSSCCFDKTVTKTSLGMRGFISSYRLQSIIGS